MTTEQRRIYKKIKQREYRRRSDTKLPHPREVVAVATDNHAISLGKAGLKPGVQYLASPRPGGCILLSPV